MSSTSAAAAGDFALHTLSRAATTTTTGPRTARTMCATASQSSLPAHCMSSRAMATGRAAAAASTLAATLSNSRMRPSSPAMPPAPPATAPISAPGASDRTARPTA
ncbi:MAG TPA: hypothetical protein PKA49_05460 [Tepidiformaceae bacterium]|nr:hypothetical protein [Tepidiformaceae bacterium]